MDKVYRVSGLDCAGVEIVHYDVPADAGDDEVDKRAGYVERLAGVEKVSIVLRALVR